MDIEITRRWLTDKTSIGEMFINGKFFSYTLEDRVRSMGIKVSGQTAISPGSYPLIIDYSQRFGKYMPHLIGVANFDGIRIHSGNTDADTSGCILLGQERGTDVVMMSRLAFSEFMAKVAVQSGMNDAGIVLLRVVEPTVVTISTVPEVDSRVGDRGGVTIQT
jgi:Family of unknown function (DUF5675)